VSAKNTIYQDADGIWRTSDALIANSGWTPKLPGQDNFSDWVTTDDNKARYISSNCECGVKVTYGNTEGSEYWHSHWCPAYKEKPKEEKK